MDTIGYNIFMLIITNFLVLIFFEGNLKKLFDAIISCHFNFFEILYKMFMACNSNSSHKKIRLLTAASHIFVKYKISLKELG